MAQVTAPQRTSESNDRSNECPQGCPRPPSPPRAATAADLRRALDNGEVRTFFQPQVALVTGELLGFEALVRWIHPDRLEVSAEELVPLAEESGLIDLLGRHVLSDACDALATWDAATGRDTLVVAVNVSPRQLLDTAFPDAVQSIIDDSGVAAGRVCLEITESALIDAHAAMSALRRLKAIGVKLSIDDFGTGYSSLSRLRCFPVDSLKIDRGFVEGVTVRSDDAAIAAAVVGLARSLRLSVVAGGIENQGQLDALAALGCEAGQGYLWSQALPAEQACAVAAEWTPFRRANLAAVVPAPFRTPAAPDPAPAEVTAFDVLEHELRTALTVVSGYAQLLQEDLEPTIRLLAAAALPRATRRANAAVRAGSDMADLGQGSMVLNTASLRASDLVHSALKVMRASHDVRVHVDVPDDAIEGDWDRLVVVMAAVLDNAAAHSPPGAAVSISAEVRRASIVIHVVDQGEGVAPGDATRIFSTFGYGSGSTGRGLSLHLARGVVRAHGGELSCLSAPSGGADFAIELPAAPVPGWPPVEVLGNAGQWPPARPARLLLVG